ncbi:hypothetical protein QBC47DRAFT_461664 [Echria macrotheca]|uniref:Uncharacterized protein n=1 Tax=Echria macrotheca TaxID=438768 RepID=A0AAJ0FAX1_9PEZI|nr:hypothetical protein QBC47DRAFT_461664 [Echria macrotheca]
MPRGKRNNNNKNRWASTTHVQTSCNKAAPVAAAKPVVKEEMAKGYYKLTETGPDIYKCRVCHYFKPKNRFYKSSMKKRYEGFDSGHVLDDKDALPICSTCHEDEHVKNQSTTWLEGDGAHSGAIPALYKPNELEYDLNRYRDLHRINVHPSARKRISPPQVNIVNRPPAWQFKITAEIEDELLRRIDAAAAPVHDIAASLPLPTRTATKGRYDYQAVYRRAVELAPKPGDFSEWLKKFKAHEAATSAQTFKTRYALSDWCLFEKVGTKNNIQDWGNGVVKEEETKKYDGPRDAANWGNIPLLFQKPRSQGKPSSCPQHPPWMYLKDRD